MKKKLPLIAVIFIVAVFLVLGRSFLTFERNKIPSDFQKIESEKIKIVTTLFPFYDFASAVAGDKAEVTLLLPAGVDPHSFEPKPSDITKINQADIFIYTSEAMEPWAHDILEVTKNENLRPIIASQDLKLITTQHDHHHENKSQPNHQTTNDQFDPHIWLDFENDQKIVKKIEKALLETDEQNKEYYQKNATDYLSKLKTLDLKYQKTLASCQNHTVIYAGHYAFAYLTDRYGLKYETMQGLSPNSQPSPQKLIELTEKIKAEKIKTIFHEELVSPKIAETLAKETDTQLLLLNGAHNLTKDDWEKKKTFLEIMENNLANLKRGLNCQN